MSSAWAAGMGAVAGAGGAMMVQRIPRGAQVSVPVCAVLVAALWAVVDGSVGANLPLW